MAQGKRLVLDIVPKLSNHRNTELERVFFCVFFADIERKLRCNQISKSYRFVFLFIGVDSDIDIRNVELSIYRIEHVLPSIPCHPRVLYADIERKLRCINY